MNEGARAEEVEREIVLYFPYNAEVNIIYKTDDNEDDFIWEEIAEAIKNKECDFYTGEYYNLTAKINGSYINFIDLSKVVGYNYSYN
jgi:hypothetical protein